MLVWLQLKQMAPKVSSSVLTNRFSYRHSCQNNWHVLQKICFVHHTGSRDFWLCQEVLKWDLTASGRVTHVITDEVVDQHKLWSKPFNFKNIYVVQQMQTGPCIATHHSSKEAVWCLMSTRIFSTQRFFRKCFYTMCCNMLSHLWPW